MKFKSLGFLFTSLIFVTACQAPILLESQPNNMTETTSSNADDQNHPAYKLLERTVNYRGQYSHTTEDSTIYIGELPDELGMALPLQDATSVVGAIVSPEVEGGGMTRIFVDVSENLEEVAAAYIAELEEMGLEEMEESPMFGQQIFTASDSSTSETFCGEEQSIMLTVSDLSVDEEPLSDVRLNIGSRENSPCMMMDMPDMMMRQAPNLPTLDAPTGARVVSSGSGGGSGSFNASADVTIDLNISDLVAHYNQQIEEQGWTLRETSSTDLIAFSVWRKTIVENDAEEEWNATLLITIDEPDSGQKSLLLQTTKRKELK